MAMVIVVKFKVAKVVKCARVSDLATLATALVFTGFKVAKWFKVANRETWRCWTGNNGMPGKFND